MLGKADRYLRTGTDPVQIYPATTLCLAQAIADTVQWSRRLPGQHELIKVNGKQLTVIQVYEGGVLTWVMRYEEEE